MTVISKYLFYQIRYLSLRLSSTNVITYIFLCELHRIIHNRFQLKKLSLHERLNVLRKMSPKHRESPIITKLDTPAFKSIFTDELNSFVSLFRKHNYEIRIAGGAVR